MPRTIFLGSLLPSTTGAQFLAHLTSVGRYLRGAGMPPLALQEEGHCLHDSMGFKLTDIGKNIAGCTKNFSLQNACCACTVHKRPVSEMPRPSAPRPALRRAGVISWAIFVFQEGGEIQGCRHGSEDVNGTAFCGCIDVGQLFGTADSFTCCELMLLSVAV